jgi:hypothetical protein
MNPPSKIIACVHSNTISRCRDKITDPKNQGEELLLLLVRNMHPPKTYENPSAHLR